MSEPLLGSVFKLKAPHAEVQSELIPRFDKVLEDWVNNVKSGYANPDYFLERTYLTKPLKLFVEKIVSSLKTPGVYGGALERGFGFGKTHSLILLWHLLTTDISTRPSLSLQAELPNVARTTLALGFDFSSDKPLARLVSTLKAYEDTKHPIARTKDPRLIQAVSAVLSKISVDRLYTLSSDELAKLIAEILDKYWENGGTPRLLLLIDELGYGLATKIRKYTDIIVRGDEKRANEIYNEANAVANFLRYLYDELQRRPYSAVVIWVFAEQDRREINSLLQKYQDNKLIYDKVKGLIDDLDVQRERYSRGIAGTSIAELSYNPDDAVSIAIHRILSLEEGVDLSGIVKSYYSHLESHADQLNLKEALKRYGNQIKEFYPLSLGLINLLRKMMNPSDMPGSEFVRTVLFMTSKAAEKALRDDPLGTYTVNLKHLDLNEIVQTKMTGELEASWIEAISDITVALNKIEDEYRGPAEFAIKYVLAKGVTAKSLYMFLSEDEREVEKYGSTLDEIQLEAIQSYSVAKALSLLEKLGKAFERVKAESARVEEKEVRGRTYYLPSITKTVYSTLSAYLEEERDRLQKLGAPIYIRESSTVQSLFVALTNIIDSMRDDAAVILRDFNIIKNVNDLLSQKEFQEAQSRGKLLLIITPPWDESLYRMLNTEGSSYDDIINGVTYNLQAALDKGEIRRPLHVLVLIPNIHRYNPVMERLLDRLVEYEAFKKFLEYLNKSKEVIDKRLEEVEGASTKRRDLQEYLKTREKELRSLIMREINEARRTAQIRLTSLAGDLVAETINLYSKVIYYSLDSKEFKVKDARLGAEVPKLEGADFKNIVVAYSPIMNEFLRKLIQGLNYVISPRELAKVISDGYKREFESVAVREADNMDEVVENILLGSYGVKPLSAKVAREAVRLLNNQTIEYDDRVIRITVDEAGGKIRFSVSLKEVEEIKEVRVRPQPMHEWLKEPKLEGGEGSRQEPVAAPETAYREYELDLKPGFSVDDLKRRLGDFQERSGAGVSEVVFSVAAEGYSLVFTLRDVSLESLNESIRSAIMNLIKRIVEEKRGTAMIHMKFDREVKESVLREVFKDYMEVRRSFDRFLPSG